jgi:hypothetical protein
MKQVKSSKQDTRRRKPIIVAGCAVLLIGIATAVLVYGNSEAPFRTTVLEVNDTSIKMKYFLKRVSLARTNPRTMLQTLADEQIIKQTAPQPPYSIRVSDEDIDRAIEEAARGQSEATNEHAFDAWYRQQLEHTGFSAAEYRDLVRANLLTQRLTRYLAERVPTVAEQVHLYMITQGSLEDAREVKSRLDAGEDFFALARELNVDEELEIGQPSSPLVFDEQLVVIILVAERAAARQIEEDTLQNLESRVLEDWLQQEYRHHRVVVHGLKNGFDGETEAWVRWQLQKMKKE